MFRDRTHAGQVLAGMLAGLAGKDRVVMAIPNGGVPVGIELARELGAPLGVEIVRKLQIPGNTEAGFGAVTSGGDVILNRMLVRALGLRPEQVREITAATMGGIAQRKALFGTTSQPVGGKTVILTDDGLASGFTMVAAARSVLRRGPKQVMVAVPTASAGAAERVARVVQRLVCPDIRRGPVFAVADAYEDWYDLDTEEAAGIYRQFVRGRRGPSGRTA